MRRHYQGTRVHYKGLMIEISYKSRVMTFVDIYEKGIPVGTVYVEMNYVTLSRASDGLFPAETIWEGELNEELNEEEFLCLMGDYYRGVKPIVDTSEVPRLPTQKEPRMSHERT